MLAVVSVLNSYVVHDDWLYLKSLDTFILCSVYEQDLVVARHKRTNYKHAIARVLYSK